MRFTPDMLIGDVLAAAPDAATVFERHGLGCASCLASGMETVSTAATTHDVDLALLMNDLESASGGLTPVRDEE